MVHKPLLFYNCSSSFLFNGFFSETNTFILVECGTVCGFGRLLPLWWCLSCSSTCISCGLVIRPRSLIRYRFGVFQQVRCISAGMLYSTLALASFLEADNVWLSWFQWSVGSGGVSLISPTAFHLMVLGSTDDCCLEDPAFHWRFINGDFLCHSSAFINWNISLKAFSHLLFCSLEALWYRKKAG